MQTILVEHHLTITGMNGQIRFIPAIPPVKYKFENFVWNYRV